jgi:hypothetical protein
MKIRSTVHWPEEGVACNEVIEVDDAFALERIAQGFAVEVVDEAPPAEESAAPAAEPAAVEPAPVEPAQQ